MNEDSPPRRLTGRVYLVTGATGGLGQVISRALAAEGATVALHGRIVRKLEAVYDSIVAAGGAQPAILPLDLQTSSDADYVRASAAIDHDLGRLDGIIHCAGMLPRLAPIEHHSADDWSAALRVNLTGPAALTRLLMPALLRSPQAVVIFTLDSRGHRPAAYWGSYAAAKAGLEALVHVLADEWQSRSTLNVYGVIPGPIDTPMRKRAYPGDEPASLRSPQSLVPLFLDLVTGARRCGGPIIDVQSDDGSIRN